MEIPGHLTTSTGETDAAIHVLMFPFLAFGHISPYVQLARKLAAVSNNIQITFLLAAANVSRVTAVLPATPSIAVVPLHLPSVPGLPAGAESTADLPPDTAELLKVSLDLTKLQVEDLLRRLRPDVILVDFGQPWVPSIAKPLGIKIIKFSVLSAAALAYLVVPARRVRGSLPTTIDDLKEKPDGFPPSSPLQSVPTFQAADFLYYYKSFDGQPCSYDRADAVLAGSDALLMKSCMEMEGHYINYVESQIGKKKVLLTGPMPPEPPHGELEPRWNEWLSGFPDGSVVFCSFGSESFLSNDSITELLLGLEAAGFAFLAVLNSPTGGTALQLPEGFEERVKGKAVVHSGWVQQQHILRHRSVGCFVCHAGLSSAIEALVADCRLVLLPQKGDQFLNAALFSDRELGVGVEVERRDEDGWFGREAVRDAVCSVMTAGGCGVASCREKWRDFLMDEVVQRRFVVDLAAKLKELIAE